MLGSDSLIVWLYSAKVCELCRVLSLSGIERCLQHLIACSEDRQTKHSSLLLQLSQHYMYQEAEQVIHCKDSAEEEVKVEAP